MVLKGLPNGVTYRVNIIISGGSPPLHCTLHVGTPKHTVCSVCVFSSHSFWTSSLLDVPAGVTQEEGHTEFLIRLLSAVRASIFLARRIQPFLSLVDCEVGICVLTISFSSRWAFLVPSRLYRIEAAGQIYKQVQSFTYLGGAVTETPDMSAEIARRTSACWARIRRYSQELYGQPKVALSLKTRMVKAEAIEALLYGCSTWTLRQEHYAKLRTVHHRVLLRIIGAQRKRPDHRMTSYNRALEITGCESIETTLRTRRLLWAGALLRMSGGRLPKRIMFGNLEGAVRRGRGGKEKEWTDCVQSDIRAFGITGDWETMAVKAEVWVEAVTKGGRRFMAAWREEEEDAARHRQEKREATRLGKLQSHTEA